MRFQMMHLFPTRIGLAAFIFVSGINLANAQDAEEIGILLAAGDIANCKSNRSKYTDVANVIRAQIMDAEKRGIPIKVLVLGDLAYEIATEDKAYTWNNRRKRGFKKRYIVHKKYRECFDNFHKTWGEFKSYMVPTPGNHDSSDDKVYKKENDIIYKRDGRKTPLKTYRKYFSEFYARIPSGNSEPGGSYVLNFPNENSDSWVVVGYNFYTGRKPALEFLRAKINKIEQKCIIGFTHPFYISSGNHGRKHRKKPKQTNTSLRDFFELMYDAKAAALITAHDHHYEQFKRQGLDRKHSSNGLRQFLVGTGGAPLYTKEANPRHHLSDTFNRKTHGVLKISLFPDRYKWTFVPIDGQEKFQLKTTEDVCRP